MTTATSSRPSGRPAAAGRRPGRPARRPPVRPFRIEDLRALTLGEVMQHARRNRHFLAVVAIVVVVGVWFPGEIALNRALTQAMLPDATTSASPAGRDAQADAVLGEVQARPGGSAAGRGGSDGSLAGDAIFDFDPGDFFDSGPVSGDPGDGGDTGGDGGDPPECDADGLLAVADEAQFLIEGPLGDDAPDLAGAAREAAGCGASTQATAAVYLLGAVAPFDDPVVLEAVKPLIGPTCGRVLNIAVGEALATQRVSPATRQALAFCFAAARFEAPGLDGPVPSSPEGGPVPPTAPSAPDVSVPDDPTDPDVGERDVVDLPGGQPPVDAPGGSSR